MKLNKRDLLDEFYHLASKSEFQKHRYVVSPSKLYILDGFNGTHVKMYRWNFIYGRYDRVVFGTDLNDCELKIKAGSFAHHDFGKKPKNKEEK